MAILSSPDSGAAVPGLEAPGRDLRARRAARANTIVSQTGAPSPLRRPPPAEGRQPLLVSVKPQQLIPANDRLGV